MSSNSTVFHLPYRKSLSAFFIAMWLPIFFVVPNEYLLSTGVMIPIMLIVLINISISLVGVWYVSKLVISDEGMILYKVNKLVWNDIVNARSSKFLGVNSIKIKRKKGLTWYLPLYMAGKTTVREALINHAPENNVIYKVANEHQTT